VKIRLIASAAVAAALALSMSGAEAATPTMDGKKVKALTMVGKGGLQTNDKDLVIDNPDRVGCTGARCGKLKFIYKPAKGVRGGLMLTSTWTNPLSDIDLYLARVEKNGTLTDVAHCGGSAGTKEKVYVAPALLSSGRTYVMVADYYRSINDTVTSKVEINVPTTIKQTMPSAADGPTYFNCTLT
jgi:hypothetical protein